MLQIHSIKSYQFNEYPIDVKLLRIQNPPHT